MSKDRILGAGVVVAIVLAITGLFLPSAVANLGAPSFSQSETTVYTQLGVTNGLIVGSSGSGISQMLSGSCNASQSTAGSHGATSTKEYFCAVTGAASGDLVFVTLPPGAGSYTSGNASNGGGFVLGSAYATTSNAIGFTITNLTGSASSSFPQATTSVKYWVIRN